MENRKRIDLKESNRRQTPPSEEQEEKTSVFCPKAGRNGRKRKGKGKEGY